VASAILVFAGLMKLWKVWVSGEFTEMPNPVFFFLSNGSVLVIAGILEICIGGAAIAFLHRTPRGSGRLLISLLCVFASYRLALVVAGYAHVPCNCLGFIGEATLSAVGLNVSTVLFFVYGFLSVATMCLGEAFAPDHGAGQYVSNRRELTSV
jgi:hypothetical protein